MQAEATIAVVGGTGKLGSAIAGRLARAGYDVVIGSRNAESAQRVASELGYGLRGTTNIDAAMSAKLVIVTVPFASQEATLRDLAPHVAGKILIDTTVPLLPPKVTVVQLPPEDSAAVRAQRILGQGVTVVSAFHNVAAHKLATDENIDCDVFVFGDDKAARDHVIALARQIGLRGIHGGVLANSAAAEAMTSLLIFINKTYKVDGAGVRITGKLIEPNH